MRAKADPATVPRMLPSGRKGPRWITSTTASGGTSDAMRPMMPCEGLPPRPNASASNYGTGSAGSPGIGAMSAHGAFHRLRVPVPVRFAPDI